VAGEDVLHGFDAGFDGILIAGGAVLTQQIFQNVGGNQGIAANAFGEVFSYHQAGEEVLYFFLQVHAFLPYHLTLQLFDSVVK